MNPFFKVHEHIASIKNAGVGYAKDTPELFEKLIKFQFKNKETIIAIHNSLIEYIESEKAIYFIRKYGSYKKDKYHLQRRGFMSEYPNQIKTVFCDNTFTEIFSAMKLCNIPYTVNDLHNLFNQEKLVVGFQDVNEERELSFYNQRKSKKIKLTNKGWYTAHIKPAGENKSYEGHSINDFFPNPDRAEYKNKSKIRVVEKDLNEKELKILKAHFLRLIHPLNSFLSPKRQDKQYEGGDRKTKSTIGEENELLSYVRDYIIVKFPEEYEEFNKLTFDYELNHGSKIENITWGLNKGIKKEKKVVNKEDNGKIKLGSHVKSVFTYFFENNMLSKDEIDNLLDPDYSKEVFGISSNNVGIIRHVKHGTKIITKSGKEHNRYWINVFDNQYHVYSQWYNTEKQWLNFKKWEEKIKNKIK